MTTIFDVPTGGTVESIIFYGPPRGRRKRLLNRIRRLLGRDEQDEVYYLRAPRPGEIVWNAAGIFSAPLRDAAPEVDERVGE